MKAAPILLVLASAFAINGCTSLGVSDLAVWAGDWTGTWSDPLTSRSGTMNITIAADGTITGTYAETEDGTFTGTITTSGAVNGAVDYPTASDITINGQAFKSGDQINISYEYHGGGQDNAGSAVLDVDTGTGP